MRRGCIEEATQPKILWLFFLTPVVTVCAKCFNVDITTYCPQNVLEVGANPTYHFPSPTLVKDLFFRSPWRCVCVCVCVCEGAAHSLLWWALIGVIRQRLIPAAVPFVSGSGCCTLCESFWLLYPLWDIPAAVPFVSHSGCCTLCESFRLLYSLWVIPAAVPFVSHSGLCTLCE